MMSGTNNKTRDGTTTSETMSDEQDEMAHEAVRRQGTTDEMSRRMRQRMRRDDGGTMTERQTERDDDEPTTGTIR